MGDYWNKRTVVEVQAPFKEFKDVFAWSYKDLKGIPLEIGVHHIDLIEGAKLVKQRPYMMNP